MRNENPYGELLISQKYSSPVDQYYLKEIAVNYLNKNCDGRCRGRPSFLSHLVQPLDNRLVISTNQLIQIMKNAFTLVLCLISIAYTQATDLAPFTKIVAGQHVELILNQGASESIEVENYDLPKDEIIVEVKGKTLHIYLRQAKNLEKQNRYKRNDMKWSTGVYADSKVTATITYRHLEKLVTKGEERITVNGTLRCPKFKFKSYGEQKVVFEDIETEHFRAKLYGNTNFEIKNGHASLQRYKLYGEHDIDTRNVRSTKVKAANFGEVDLDVNTEVVALTSFGEASIRTATKAEIRKGIVIGQTRIR